MSEVPSICSSRLVVVVRHATTTAKRSACFMRVLSVRSFTLAPSRRQRRLHCSPCASMLFLLSPAKTLDERPAGADAPSATTPVFAADATKLAGALSALPVADLRTLLSVSAPLAELNARRYRAFPTAPAKHALFTFNGQAYARNALDAGSLKAPQVLYLQQRLRILCGLYGVLRPLDAIKPYRLEMGAKLGHLRSLDAVDLYAFWGDRLARQVAEDVRCLPEEERCVVNVASGEYSAAVLKRHAALLGCLLVTCVFPGPAVHAKAARGGIVRYAAVTGATRVEQLKDFSGHAGEWRFSEAQSNESTLVFLRTAGAKTSRKLEQDEEEEEEAAPAAKKRVAPKSRA